MHGMTVYNVLRGLPCDLTIHNIGNVDSIGNAIFLAGKHRYACKNSTFMFHGVGFDSRPDCDLRKSFYVSGSAGSWPTRRASATSSRIERI
jgi:hypothetical protein